jgi:heptosyltransferase-2
LKATTQDIKRIVVRAPNWLGDVVMSVAALRQLRASFPDAHIAVVARPGAAEIFTGADFIDEVVPYDRASLSSFWQQTRAWKRRKFDAALLFQNAFEAAAIAYLAAVPVRIGYDTDKRAFLLTHPIATPAWKNERHETFYYLELVAELEKASGREPAIVSDPQFQVEVSGQRKQQASEMLSREGINVGVPLALLCPGSVNSRAKRWPAERYAELADRLSDAGVTVALIGSPGEIDVSEKVATLARTRPVFLTGKTSVSELVGVIKVADILITNDTGPAHIGAAVGTPTLAIFGPTNPLTTRPFGPAGRIIQRPPDCAPCMLRDCPIDHRCMTAITADEVFAQAREAMQRLEVAV